MDMSKKHGFFEGLLVGAVMGAAIGFLTKNGDETKEQFKKIKQDNEDLIENAKQKTEVLINKTRESIDDIMKKLGKFVEEKKKK